MYGVDCRASNTKDKIHLKVTETKVLKGVRVVPLGETVMFTRFALPNDPPVTFQNKKKVDRI